MKECTLPPLSNLCTAIFESFLAFIVAPCTSLQAHLDVPRLRPPEPAAVTVFVALGAALGMATTAAGHLCCWLVRSWCPAESQPSLGASSQARHNSPVTSLLTRVATDSLFVDSCLMPPVFVVTTVRRALSCQHLNTHGCWNCAVIDSMRMKHKMSCSHALDYLNRIAFGSSKHDKAHAASPQIPPTTTAVCGG